MTLVDFGEAASFATRFPNAVIDRFRVGPSLMRSCVGSSASFSAPGNSTTKNREVKGSWLSLGTLGKKKSKWSGKVKFAYNYRNQLVLSNLINNADKICFVT